MDYKKITETVKTQLQGYQIKYALILFMMLMISTVLNQINAMEVILENNFIYILFVIIILFLSVVQNTVYFLFIKRVRKEKFGMSDIRYSFSKTLLHLSSSILLAILQMGIQMIVLLIASFAPMLVSPIMIIVQVFVASVSVFIAFGIYDGIRGAMVLVNCSFKLMKKHIKNIFLIALPYLIWTLLCQLGMNFLLTLIQDTVSTSTLDVIMKALSTSDVQIYGWMMLGLMLIRTLGECFLLVPVYTGYANMYEADYCDIYPMSHMPLSSNVIDIDVEES